MSVIKQKKTILSTFLKDISLYSLEPLFFKLISFILIPVYTAYLLPSDFGALQFILTIGAFLRSFTQMGLNTAFWKFRSKTKISAIFSIPLIVLITQFYIGIIVLSLGIIISFYFDFANVTLNFVLIYFLALLIKLITENYLLVCRANHNPKKYLIISISQSVFLFSLNIYFVKYLKLNFQGVIFAYLFSFLISSFIFFIFIKKDYVGRVSLKLSSKMIKFGYPIMISNFFVLILSISDRWFLKTFSSDYELGLYSYGYKFADLILAFLIQTFQTAWIPIAWKIYSLENGKDIFVKAQKIFFFLLPIISFFLLTFIIIIGKWSTINDSYLKGFQIIYLIAFSHVFYGFYSFSVMGIYFTDKTNKILRINLISAVINISLNIILIPSLGMLGSAVATFVSYILLYLMVRYYSNKFYPLNISSLIIFKQVFIIVFFVAIMTYIGTQFSNLYWNALCSFFVSIIYFLVLYMFGFISVDQIVWIKTLFNKSNYKKVK